MKLFSPNLIERLGSADEAVAAAAHEEWESVLERYEGYLQSIEPELPEHIRAFNNLLLHDAIVWSIVRQGDQLIMVLRKDIPPRDVVILSYFLTEEPVLDEQALPVGQRGPVMDFQYDEFELLREQGRNLYAQSILFGNGWEIQLRFSDVRVSVARPVYPLPDTVLVPVTCASARSA
jgi:hypothetical protein